MFRHVEDTLRQHPHFVAVSTDMVNAFNSFDRATLWDLLETHFPELAAHVRMVYGVPSEVLLKEAGLDDPITILNSVGSRQGCPSHLILSDDRFLVVGRHFKVLILPPGL